MPSAIGVMFVLYILVSIVTGIVSSVIKKSQTTARRPRPVYVPGRQIPYPAELDLHDLEERVSCDADGRPEERDCTEGISLDGRKRLLLRFEKLEDHSGSAVVDRPSHTNDRGIRSTSEGNAAESLGGRTRLPARLLSRPGAAQGRDRSSRGARETKGLSM